MVSRFVARRIKLSANRASSRDIRVDVSLPCRLLKTGDLPRASSILASELAAATFLAGQDIPASIYNGLRTSAADIFTLSFTPGDLPTTSTFSDLIVPVTLTSSASSSSIIPPSSLSSTSFEPPSSAADTTFLTSITLAAIALPTTLSSSANTSEFPNESAPSSATAIVTPPHANQTRKWVGIGLGIASFLLIVSVIIFFLFRYKRNCDPKPEPEHNFIGGHELNLKRQAEAQAVAPYIPPRRKSKKVKAEPEAWKGGTTLNGKEEEAAEKTFKEVEEKEAQKANKESNDEPIGGPLKVVNSDGVSLMEDEDDDKDDLDGTKTTTVEQSREPVQKARGDVTEPQEIGVALTCEYAKGNVNVRTALYVPIRV
ncbi:hypothetical protein ACMFMG_007134 [Clarireedia jacksonii]